MREICCSTKRERERERERERAIIISFFFLIRKRIRESVLAVAKKAAATQKSHIPTPPPTTPLRTL
jgi:hypothetical protein